MVRAQPPSPIDAAAFNTLVLAIHDNAAVLPVVDFKAWLVAALRQHLRFDSALIGFGNVVEGEANIPTFYLYNLPERVMAEREPIRDLDLVGQRASAAPGKAILVHVLEVADDPKYAPLVEYCRRYGLMNVVCTAIPPTAALDVQCFVSLFRAADDDVFNEDERQMHELLMPHIARGLAANRRASLQRFSMLDVDRGRVRTTADRRGHLYDADPGFIELIRAHVPTFDGKVLPEDVRAQLGRKTIVRHTTSFAVFDIVPTNDMFFLSARRLIPVDALSAREREVAESFAAGLTHKEIARQLALAPATVRRHLQNVYTKLSVDTKAALIRVLG